MGQEKLYIEKEISWLSFNERVLQEAADKSNPYSSSISSNIPAPHAVTMRRTKRSMARRRRSLDSTGIWFMLMPVRDSD
ncbi:hypothetical protein CRX72_24930 [Pantoea sp. BRM17]|nr:hypothetical protein CRX72_24930 [Pantoea sp. BRM17]